MEELHELLRVSTNNNDIEGILNLQYRLVDGLKHFRNIEIMTEKTSQNLTQICDLLTRTNSILIMMHTKRINNENNNIDINRS